ncbi:MAG: hypothetical protein AB1486_27420 [Planctomycetota bacterium]
MLPPDTEADRTGIAEMQHIAGLNAMQRELRRRYPRLVMEGCCGGGRRIDLDSISCFHWHQKSDAWFDTVSDQCGLHGANLFLPGGVINVPTQAVDDFGLWSSFAGQLCLAWHPLDADFPMEKALAQVQLYKRVRPYLSGDFYPLTECELEAPWLAMQFHRHDLDEGLVLLFKRHAGGGDVFELSLRGLEPERRYELHFEAGSDARIESGGALRDGVRVTLHRTPDAELITYRRASD